MKIDDDKEQSSITNKIKEMRLAQVSDLKRNDENVSILVSRYIHLPNHKSNMQQSAAFSHI